MPDFLRTPKKKNLLEEARRDTKARKRRERDKRKKRLAIERVKAWSQGDLHKFLRLHMMRPGDLGKIDPSKPIGTYVAAERQSTVSGVTWSKSHQCWEVAIYMDNARHMLGRFKMLPHAEYACLQAKKALGLPNRPKAPHTPRPYTPKGVKLPPKQLELPF